MLGIALNLLIVFGSTVIFAILILLLHEYGLSFHLLYLQFLYLEFSLQRFFIFLISFSFFLFLRLQWGMFHWFSFFNMFIVYIYMNASDFCMLILYPATFLEVLIRSKSFQQSHSGLLCIESCYLQLRILWLFFPNYIPFISFTWSSIWDFKHYHELEEKEWTPVVVWLWMVPKGSYIWILFPQSVEPFGKNWEMWVCGGVSLGLDF